MPRCFFPRKHGVHALIINRSSTAGLPPIPSPLSQLVAELASSDTDSDRRRTPTPTPYQRRIESDTDSEKTLTPSLPLITVLCRLFKCKPGRLRGILGDPLNRKKAEKHLRKSTLYTTHLKDGRNFKVRFGMLTRKSSHRLMAYNGFLQITVRQHMYARHRLNLRWPDLPCICMFGPKRHRDYFPLEVLSVV